MRGFRAVYLGLFFNCVIMATVNLAAAKIGNIVLGWSMQRTLLLCSVITIFFASVSGLWGVLVTDSLQFSITMTGTFAVAYFAVKQPQVGGLAGLVARTDPKTLNLLPDFGDWKTALAVLVIPITIQWWSVWYPGAEPGGGSYIAQRMLASRSEKDALTGTLLFNVMHYALRPWPWIIVALSSILIYPSLSDIQKAFPYVDPKLIGNDMAYPAMLRFLPAGFLGLMVAGLLAAYRSTIETHLNWGTSYLVHDFYRRFLRRSASREALRLHGAPRDGAPDGLRRAPDLRSRHRQGELRSHPVDRRGHGADLPAALVLVADQRLERSGRDGELIRRRGGVLRGRKGRGKGRRRTCRCS